MARARPPRGSPPGAASPLAGAASPFPSILQLSLAALGPRAPEAALPAVRRLAYFTDIIGDAKLKVYVEGTIDPTDPTKKLEYRDGLYLQSRPGQSALPANNGNATPLPVAP